MYQKLYIDKDIKHLISETSKTTTYTGIQQNDMKRKVIFKNIYI